MAILTRFMDSQMSHIDPVGDKDMHDVVLVLLSESLFCGGRVTVLRVYFLALYLGIMPGRTQGTMWSTEY